MRLSEAIRLGSMMGPQARGELTRTRRKYIFFGPLVNEYCAMGAAFVASGAPTVRRTYDTAGESEGFFRGGVKRTHKAGESYLTIEHQWVNLTWQEFWCPLCPGDIKRLYQLIPHLNDDHRWTREQIADFVERIEQPETVAALDPVGQTVTG